MTAYSITGLTSMGAVTKEESTKDAGLFQIPMPMADSTEQVLVDIFGASRIITISGIYTTGAGSYTVAQFIVALDALVDGSKTSATVYTSGKSGVSYNGLVTKVSWSSEEGAVGKVDYTITFTEGTV